MMNKSAIASLTGAAVLLLLFWGLLSRGELSSLLVGLPFLGLALFTWLRLRSDRPANISWFFSFKSLALFLLYFIVESIKGAWDVSRKVLMPTLALKSTFHNYPIHLESIVARRFFMGSISLLPGTLSVDGQGDYICVHILDDQDAAINGIVRLEQKIAALFGEDHDF